MKELLSRVYVCVGEGSETRNKVEATDEGRVRLHRVM
jgi:hypothetical protein